MKNLFPECVQIKNGKIEPIAENGRSLIIENPGRRDIEIGRVDGCIINDSRKRCDYFMKYDDNIIYLIELKGTDYKNAVSQILETAEYFYGLRKCKEMIGLIVGSKVPRINTAFQNAKIKSKNQCRKLHLNIEIPKSKSHKITI